MSATNIKEITDLEERYEELKNKILYRNKIIKRIPFKRLQMYLVKKKIFPLQEDYQKTFVLLRQITRKVYPERFIQSEGNR